jgi:hypothetical protein
VDFIPRQLIELQRHELGDYVESWLPAHPEEEQEWLREVQRCERLARLVMTRQYIRCVFCSTQVEVTPERVEDVILDGPGSETRGLRMVECPVCRTSIEVPEN